jgi:hypothetical protein
MCYNKGVKDEGGNSSQSNNKVLIFLNILSRNNKPGIISGEGVVYGGRRLFYLLRKSKMKRKLIL